MVTSIVNSIGRETRKRRKSNRNNISRRNTLFDPAYELAKTLSQRSGTIDSSLIFPNKNTAFTVAVDITVSGGAPGGVILDLGSSTTGLALWFDTDTNKIGFAVGDGTGDDGISGLSDFTFTTLNQQLKIVASVLPGTGDIRLWVNGKLEIREQSASYNLPNGWGDDTTGQIGNIGTSINPRVPVNSRIALTDISINGSLDFYKNQKPEHFNASKVSI